VAAVRDIPTKVMTVKLVVLAVADTTLLVGVLKEIMAVAAFHTLKGVAGAERAQLVLVPLDLMPVMAETALPTLLQDPQLPTQVAVAER
jgi:hypothetical protein